MTNAPAVGASADCVKAKSVTSAIAMLLGTIALLALSAGSAAASPNSLALGATYEVNARIHWERGAMSVTSTAHVTNLTASNVRTLVFNLVPLLTGNASLLRVAVDQHDVEPQSVGQTIVVTLPRTLRPGKQVVVTVLYRAAFNAIVGTRQELFMQQGEVITAYRWIPWLSRKQPFVAPNSGETWVSSVSPRVKVTFFSRKRLVFATSGQQIGKGSNSQTFVANNVRDFNFSASPDYRVRSVSANGVQVNAYYVGLSGKTLLRYAVAALKKFDEVVGPYSYPQLNIAETPFGSGMESPGLSWIPLTVDANRLERLVTHEVAHQWFYATVGNNQALNPFVDEALADFLTDDMLGTFRRARCPIDSLDRSVYYYNAKCYPEVIYVQGSRYLEHYKSAVGNDAFWAGLRAFYDSYAFKIAGTRALWDTLDSVSGYDSELHSTRFPTLYP